jgi:hypothetical protein
MIQRTEFLSYVYDFYGVGGIYDMGVTTDDLLAAYLQLANRPDCTIEFDSVDRERIRDILIEDFGYKFPEML